MAGGGDVPGVGAQVRGEAGGPGEDAERRVPELAAGEGTVEEGYPAAHPQAYARPAEAHECSPELLAAKQRGGAGGLAALVSPATDLLLRCAGCGAYSVQTLTGHWGMDDLLRGPALRGHDGGCEG